VLEQVGEKMAPVIREFLMKSASLVTYAGKTTQGLINYKDTKPLNVVFTGV
jgi:hypothetical protein